MIFLCPVRWDMLVSSLEGYDVVLHTLPETPIIFEPENGKWMVGIRSFQTNNLSNIYIYLIYPTYTTSPTYTLSNQPGSLFFFVNQMEAQLYTPLIQPGEMTKLQLKGGADIRVPWFNCRRLMLVFFSAKQTTCSLHLLFIFCKIPNF